MTRSEVVKLVREVLQELQEANVTGGTVKNSRDLMAALPFVRSTILPAGNHSLPVNKPLSLFKALEKVLSE